jgi:uncharacterized membrane protein YdbT with pleckstrin-like domain
MSYIESNLMPGERLVYRARLHWILLGRSAVFGVLGLIFLLWAVTGDSVSYLACLGVPLILLALLQLGYVFLAYQNWEYGVTNRRVIVKTGILRHKSLELLLGKVEGIAVTEPILGRILGYGTIVISGTGGTRERFPWIADPGEFRRRVHAQMQVAP